MRCWCSISSFFFFSSRRRHTRFDCDWSSDVCSSDLAWVDEQRKIAAAKKDDPSKVWSLPDLMARGEKVYAANCAACHQANGKGAGPIKPLDGSPIVLGPTAEMMHVVLEGRANGAMQI